MMEGPPPFGGRGNVRAPRPGSTSAKAYAWDKTESRPMR